MAITLFNNNLPQPPTCFPSLSGAIREIKAKPTTSSAETNLFLTSVLLQKEPEVRVPNSISPSPDKCSNDHVSRMLADAGQFAEAEGLINSILDAKERLNSFEYLIGKLIEAGQFTATERVLGSISPPPDKYFHSRVSRMFAGVGQFAQAERAANAIRSLWRSETDQIKLDTSKWIYSTTLGYLNQKLIKDKEYRTAYRIAIEIPSLERSYHALHDLFKALTRDGLQAEAAQVKASMQSINDGFNFAQGMTKSEEFQRKMQSILSLPYQEERLLALTHLMADLSTDKEYSILSTFIQDLDSTNKEKSKSIDNMNIANEWNKEMLIDANEILISAKKEINYWKHMVLGFGVSLFLLLSVSCRCQRIH